MMNESKYFLVKVLVFFTDGEKVKKKMETYLVEAVSVTDAEVIVTQKFSNYPNDWSIKSVSESNIVDIWTVND